MRPFPHARPALTAALLLLPPVLRQIEWRPVLTLLAGAIVLTPVGALILILGPLAVKGGPPRNRAALQHLLFFSA